jgi:hypothetical protein
VVSAAANALITWVSQTFEPLGKVLSDNGKNVVRQSSIAVGKALDALDAMGVPAMVVPLRRAGEQLLRSLFGGLMNPSPSPPPAPPEEDAAPPPPADAPAPAAAPGLPPVEAQGRGSVLWLAAALAGGLLPVWREAARRDRDRRRNRRI